MRDLLVAAAAYLFLAGILLLVLSAVPALARRWPRLLLIGFGMALLSFALVGAAALFPP